MQRAEKGTLPLCTFPETYHSSPEEDIRQIPTEGHSVKSGQSSSKPSKVIKTQGCLRNSQPRGAEEAWQPTVWYILGRGGGAVLGQERDLGKKLRKCELGSDF